MERIQVEKIIERALKEGRKHLAENEVKEIIKRAGMSTTDFQYFHEFSELDVQTLKFPAVLKVCSPDILHKTDFGGVILDIGSLDELKALFEEFKKKFPNQGFLVESMYSGRIEVIIGVVNDPSFGLTIMFGIGGIYTEVYKDVTFRVIPITRMDAEEMLSEIKAAPILEGFRKVEIDREGLVDLLLKVSELASRLEKFVDQMDLNPVFLTSEDVRVVDAKMLLK